MNVKEIEGKLIEGGCSLSENYGLILGKEDSKYVIADVRKSEGMVVVPFWNKIITEEERELMKILNQKRVPFRNKPRNNQ
jgi:hypothetical protein